MEAHPYAKLFPMISNAELTELAEDIKVNGLRTAIVVDSDGFILDGRNREAACHRAGIEPRTELFTGGNEDKLAFVISQNLKRRHLSESQRAAVAARLKPYLENEAANRVKATQASPGERVGKARADLPAPTKHRRSRDEAGKALNVSGRLVTYAETVLNSGSPELVAAVDSGKVKVCRAVEIAKLPKEEQAQAIEEKPSRKREKKPKSEPKVEPAYFPGKANGYKVSRFNREKALVTDYMDELQRLIREFVSSIDVEDRQLIFRTAVVPMLEEEVREW